MATINGREVEFGCVIDGHWGQYGPDRLADIAEGFGMELPDYMDPRWWREMAERPDDPNTANSWESHHETADLVERWLNDHADGCLVEWVDGECFIVERRDGFTQCPECFSWVTGDHNPDVLALNCERAQ